MGVRRSKHIVVLLAAFTILSGWAIAQVSESTRVYANLPAQIEISIPTQYKDLQMSGCEPAKQVSVPGAVEVKSNTNWGMTVAGSTSSGRMTGSTGIPLHELHNSMSVQTQNPAGGPTTVPGTGSSPPAAAILTNVAPGDYSGPNIIGLTFQQLFSWSDYADDNYQITVTLTATPA